jgi:hypothetical protein
MPREVRFVAPGELALADYEPREPAEGKLSGEDVVYPVVRFEKIPEEYMKTATDTGSNMKLGAEF